MPDDEWTFHSPGLTGSKYYVGTLPVDPQVGDMFFDPSVSPSGLKVMTSNGWMSLEMDVPLVPEEDLDYVRRSLGLPEGTSL